MFVVVQALSAMVKLELPHINVLTKIDICENKVRAATAFQAQRQGLCNLCYGFLRSVAVLGHGCTSPSEPAAKAALGTSHAHRSIYRTHVSDMCFPTCRRTLRSFSSQSRACYSTGCVEQQAHALQPSMQRCVHCAVWAAHSIQSHSSFCFHSAGLHAGSWHRHSCIDPDAAGDLGTVLEAFPARDGEQEDMKSCLQTKATSHQALGACRWSAYAAYPQAKAALLHLDVLACLHCLACTGWAAA